MVNHSLRGRKAQAQGAAFEALFLRAATSHSIVTTRIPDGCKQLPGGKIRRVPTPFDWAMSLKTKVAFIDTKCLDKNTFPHASIEPHQALALLRHELEGITAGYIVWLKKTNKVIFIPAKLLCEAMQKTGSISEQTPGTIDLGTMEAMNLKVLFQ